MEKPLLGVVMGVLIGAADVALMLPMDFPDKGTALLGAFFSRFGIGFLACNVGLPFHQTASGALVGLLISIPDAVITKAYAPILVTGVLFGAIAGWASRRWGK
jgi:hypothetical protein